MQSKTLLGRFLLVCGTQSLDQVANGFVAAAIVETYENSESGFEGNSPIRFGTVETAIGARAGLFG